MRLKYERGSDAAYQQAIHALLLNFLRGFETVFKSRSNYHAIAVDVSRSAAPSTIRDRIARACAALASVAQSSAVRCRLLNLSPPVCFPERSFLHRIRRMPC
jgi:hypothetical protein